MNSDFIAALKQIEKEREIPLEVILIAIEDALAAAYKRNYLVNYDVMIKIDRVTGMIHAVAEKVVVDKVTNPQGEILLEAARQLEPEAELGSLVRVEVTPDDFGRIAAQTAKQVIVQRIREAERDIVFNEFIRRESDIVSGVVNRYEQKNYLIDLGKVEGIITPAEQVPGEFFKHGDRLKAFILEARKTPKGPQVILSRTHPQLVAKLFEAEVPEIAGGLITINAVVREAGNRTKIAVESKDPKIDPVGACVGPKGSRVQNIVDELKGEKIDIIPWSADPVSYISNSLSPAKVLKVSLYHADKSALVVVPDHQLSLAIGKEGQNVRLAAKLTLWKIDIKSESQYEANKEEIEARAEELSRQHAQEEAARREEELRLAQLENSQPEPSEDEYPEDGYAEEETDDYYEESPGESEDRESEEIYEEEEYSAPSEPTVSEPVTEVSSDGGRSKKKKRKERRVEEEREDMMAKKKKKTRKNKAETEEYDEEYDLYSW